MWRGIYPYVRACHGLQPLGNAVGDLSLSVRPCDVHESEALAQLPRAPHVIHHARERLRLECHLRVGGGNGVKVREMAGEEAGARIPDDKELWRTGRSRFSRCNSRQTSVYSSSKPASPEPGILRAVPKHRRARPVAQSMRPEAADVCASALGGAIEHSARMRVHALSLLPISRVLLRRFVEENPQFNGNNRRHRVRSNRDLKTFQFFV